MIKKTLPLSLSLIMILSGCGSIPPEEKKELFLPKVSVMEVAPGLHHEFSVTGQVQAEKSADLASEISGQISSIAVKAGQSVSAGQILVTLKSDAVSASIDTASSALRNAQESVTRTTSSADQSIESARVALVNAQQNLETTLNQTASQRKQAEEILKSATLASNLSTSSAQTTLDNSIRSVPSGVQTALDAADTILGVSQVREHDNDAFESQLGALLPQTKTDAQNALQNLYPLAANSSDTENAANALLSATESMLQKTLTMLNKSVAGGNYPQATLSGHITTINGQLSAIRSLISTIASSRKALDSAAQSSGGSSQSVAAATANYNATMTALLSAEDAARRQVESASTAYESAKRGSDLSKLGATSGLTSAAGGYRQAAASAEKLVIRAPFAGKVVELPKDNGDTVSPGMLLARVENGSTLKVIANLSAEEVSRVHFGDLVKIGKSSEDRISAISPSADPVSRKFRVEILTKNPFLVSGDFITLRFQTGEQAQSTDQRIFVPVTAIQIWGNETFVWTVPEIGSGSTAITKKRPITIGTVEGDQVEITSGLDLGEMVVTEGGRILEKEGTEVKVQK